MEDKARQTLQVMIKADIAEYLESGLRPNVIAQYMMFAAVELYREKLGWLGVSKVFSAALDVMIDNELNERKKKSS